MFYSSTVCRNTTKKDKRLLCTTMDFVNGFRSHCAKHPNIVKDNTYNCHSICRALAKAIPELSLVDGNFMGLKHMRKGGKLSFAIRLSSHSWLQTPDNAIIDPYPVGLLVVNPILVVNKGIYAPFGGKMYVPDNMVTKKIATREVANKSRKLYQLLLDSRK